MEMKNVFDGKKINNYMQQQFKKIKKLDVQNIMSNVKMEIKSLYTVNNSSRDEISIKIDKKQNIDDIEKNVNKILTKTINNSDVNSTLLFSIIQSSSSELIIRLKRVP